MPTSSSVALLAGRAVVASALMAALVWLGQIPWGKPSNEGVLRIALRTVRGRLEVCRQLTAAELEALPQHMRGTTDCDAYPVVYRLRVDVDGERAIDERVAPGGVRRDRPHNTDRELGLPPGSAELWIRFAPELPDGASPEAENAFAELPTYELRRSVRVAADRVTLIYLDDASGELEVIGP